MFCVSTSSTARHRAPAPLTGSTDEAITQLAAFVNGLDKTPLTTPDSDATINTWSATNIIRELAVAQPDWDTLTAMLTPAMTNHDGTLMAKAMKGSPGLLPEMTAEEAARSANAMILGDAVVCNDNANADRKSVV